MIRRFYYIDKQVTDDERRYLYQYINVKELDQHDLNFFPKGKKTHQNFLDIGCGFDIETTKIKDKHLSFMYIWMFSLDNIVIYGQDWPSFIKFIDLLKNIYRLGEKRKLCVLVHNLPFEFQFIKKLLPWKTNKYGTAAIFALDPRKIVKAEIDGIEFHDTLALTNVSLAKMAKDYKLNHQKLVGDLDYSITRVGGENPTELSEEELAYCFNDVLILSDFWHDFIMKYFLDHKIKIPLTSTGIIRDELKRNFKKLNPKLKNEFQKVILRAYPNERDYKILNEWVYRGGFVHSAPGLTDSVLITGLGGVDFKSAYPAALLQSLVPWEFIDALPEEWPKMLDERITKSEAFYGYFEITGIKSKGLISYESSSKIVEYENARWDNGRLWAADKIRVWLTELDLQIYTHVYDIDLIECLELHKSIKKPIPEYLKDLILKYFVAKEEIGKIDKESIDYKNAKSRLNSIYGMVCTQLYIANYEYNMKSGLIESVPTGKTYNELIEDQILLPQWGIWCTAIVRHRLIVSGFCRIGEDAIYGDTDSIKLLNFDNNKWVFDDFNKKIRKINANMYIASYKRELFKDLGIFDIEYNKMFKFKCLGAKRYLYSYAAKDKETCKYKLRTISTVAGMKKGTLEAYAKANNISVYDAFKDGLVLDLTMSKKLTSIYNDDGFEEIVTDLQGNTQNVKELSCVTLVEIPFKLNMMDDYLKFLAYIKGPQSNRMVQKRYINQIL